MLYVFFWGSYPKENVQQDKISSVTGASCWDLYTRIINRHYRLQCAYVDIRLSAVLFEGRSHCRQHCLGFTQHTAGEEVAAFRRNRHFTNISAILQRYNPTDPSNCERY
jgi:hypothetical protein